MVVYLINRPKMGNLILTESNPSVELRVLENPEIRLIRGRQIKRNRLGKFEQKARNRNNLIVSAVRYAQNLVTGK